MEHQAMTRKETTFEQTLREAIERRDVRRIGQLVDALRFRAQASYAKCYELATRLTGISPDEWDELLYEADMGDE